MKILLIALLLVFLTACSLNPAETIPRDPSSTGNETGAVTNLQKTDSEDIPEAGQAAPGNGGSAEELKQASGEEWINGDGTTVAERIKTPPGFERVPAAKGSFGEYLRKLPLKPQGTRVRYYNGDLKPGGSYIAVLDMDVGDQDLQQCADAVIRLRAEYLYGQGLYDAIHFNFTNGFRAEYGKWRQGQRIRVTGNQTVWVNKEKPSDSYASFRKYLDTIFAYAGTLSLSKELKKVAVAQLQIGDVFIRGGSPGHCVLVLDTARNPETGESVFLLAQSYMPAQDIHILKNPSKQPEDPWYPVDFGDRLKTPDWEFDKDQLARFGE